MHVDHSVVLKGYTELPTWFIETWATKALLRCLFREIIIGIGITICLRPKVFLMMQSQMNIPSLIACFTRMGQFDIKWANRDFYLSFNLLKKYFDPCDPSNFSLLAPLWAPLPSIHSTRQGHNCPGSWPPTLWKWNVGYKWIFRTIRTISEVR